MKQKVHMAFFFFLEPSPRSVYLSFTTLKLCPSMQLLLRCMKWKLQPVLNQKLFFFHLKNGNQSDRHSAYRHHVATGMSRTCCSVWVVPQQHFPCCSDRTEGPAWLKACSIQPARHVSATARQDTCQLMGLLFKCTSCHRYLILAVGKEVLLFSISKPFWLFAFYSQMHRFCSPHVSQLP